MGDACDLDELLDAARDGDLSKAAEILEASQTNIRLLLRHSDLERWTPLHFAAGNDHGKVVGILLEYRADALAKTYKGDTPLHCGCQHDAANSVQQLLAKSWQGTIELLQATNRHYETALHVAVVSVSAQLWASLVDAAKGCRPCLEQRSDDGGTALHYAALEGNAIAFESLLQARADPGAIDCQAELGRTLLSTDKRTAHRSFDSRAEHRLSWQRRRSKP